MSAREARSDPGGGVSSWRRPRGARSVVRRVGERGEFAHCAVGEQVHDADSAGADCLPQRRHDLGGEQRVSAQIEEVVVEADLSAPSTSRQTSAITAASRSAAAGRRRPSAPAGHRGRQSPAVELPVRCHRQPVERHERGRNHVVRQPLPSPGPPRGASRRCRRRAGPGSSTMTAASRMSACSRSTDSISPGSMRSPRSLIWASTRPRKSRVPSSRQRARSPVR